MSRFVIVGSAVAVAIVVATIFILFLPRNLAEQNASFQGSSTQQTASQPRAGAVDTSVFADGIGIYSRDDAKYNMLVWKKRLINARGTVDEKDIQEAFRDAAPVRRTVKFFSFGLDIASWPVVPPYSMAFCYVPDTTTVAGIFPMRIVPRGPQVYELILPPIINDLAAGTAKHLFWGINFQYSCNDAWVFKFATP